MTSEYPDFPVPQEVLLRIDELIEQLETAIDRLDQQLSNAVSAPHETVIHLKAQRSKLAWQRGAACAIHENHYEGYFAALSRRNTLLCPDCIIQRGAHVALHHSGVDGAYDFFACSECGSEIAIRFN